ncbi:MAG: hybrid sensor histidine kinase/response regulator [Verrucomicrobia bacterium]|nr:MAG: hybrid sensor histidine kinase/response regulator [Verrucomicrobiota bacterium]
MNEAPPAANIMIVDDEPENLNVLEALLTQAGYLVSAFPRGELALAAACHQAPDLVLLDVRMPGLDGHEVCRRFKAHEDLRGIPILFISALSAAEDIAAGLECGGVDYIAKPFSKPEVLARVCTHIALRGAYLQLAAEHARLQSLERHRDLLTHMLVHDMRGPLQVIGGHLEILASCVTDPVPVEQRQSLRAATRGVRLLSQMVSTVVDLSRIEGTGMPLRLLAVGAGEIFRGACAQVLDPADSRHIAEHIGADCPLLLCDLEVTVRIVANLLANALKHAPDSSSIELGAVGVDGGVCLWVRDCGPGIAAEDQQRIFDKFVVLQQPSGNFLASIGLGLAFCKLAVQAHGGRIGVASESGVGSTFWCHLPAAAPNLMQS